MCSQGIRAASESTFAGSNADTEAKSWIGRKSKAWLKNGATRMISQGRAAPDSFRRRAFSTFLRLGPARFVARLTSPLLLPVFFASYWTS